jgi:WD40 repeat protein
MDTENNDQTLKLEKTIRNIHTGRINFVDSFPSGNLISVSDDFSINIYDQNFNIIQKISEAHNHGITFVDIKDENNFVTCSGDQNIKTWKKEGNKFIENIIILKAHNEKIFKVNYIKGDKLISCSEDETIKFWEKINEKYQNITSLQSKGRIYTFLYLEDKKIIVVGGDNGTIIYNMITFEIIKTFDDTFCGSWNSLIRIDDDRILVQTRYINSMISVISIQGKCIFLLFLNEFQFLGIGLIKEKNILL